MEQLLVALVIFILGNIIHLEVVAYLNRRDIMDLKRKFLFGDFTDRR